MKTNGLMRQFPLFGSFFKAMLIYIYNEGKESKFKQFIEIGKNIPQNLIANLMKNQMEGN
jgi:hypothetical protein